VGVVFRRFGVAIGERGRINTGDTLFCGFSGDGTDTTLARRSCWEMSISSVTNGGLERGR
jgi:hypothetical protein